MRLTWILVFVSAAAVLTAQSNDNKTPTRIAGAHAAKEVPAPVRLDEKQGFQDRIAKVGDDVYVSGQPTEKALRELKDRGVTTIVNLRTPPEMAKVGFDEAALAKSLGMKYLYLPVRGTAEFPYSPDTLTKFAAAMKEADGAVLLHCTVGWRASHLWTAYLIQERGMSPAEAVKHGHAINLMDDHHMVEGRQPVEDFLGRDLPELKK
jgi:uncharacterized protein (TIGR01244 family)